jgi:dihydropteroate synthase
LLELLSLEKSTVYVDTVGIGEEFPVRVMGVLNISPESFYAESIEVETDQIAARARQMVEEGANIIDIGGVSTAPAKYYDTERVSTVVEMKRIEYALDALTDSIEVPISVDTTSSQVAERALELGASVINDVSGLQGDRNMAEIISQRKVPVVVMSSCANACQSVEQSVNSLKKSLQIAHMAGIDASKIIIDPGIGFGKPPDVDYEIVRHLKMFTSLGHPVLIGVSRKAFIGHLLEQEEPSERLQGSIAVTSIAVANGADIVRTHDVKETVVACRIGKKLR